MPNITANTIRGIYAKTIPLNTKITVGNMESDKTFNFPFLLPQIIQKVI